MIGAMSLWSGPQLRRFGGYSEHFLMLWGLSVCLARQHFKKLVLYADAEGADLLKDFPYDEFRTILGDHLTPPQATHLWCAGKIAAYRDMAHRGEAFCHIDGDVLLFKRPHLLGAPVFAQSAEPFFNPPRFGWQDAPAQHILVGVYIKNAVTDLRYLPPYVRFSLTREFHRPFNTGIVGGNDINFLTKYADDAWKTIHHPLNLDKWSNCIPICVACFLEQYFLGALSLTTDTHVSTMFQPASVRNEAYMKEIGYCHLLGDSKRHLPTMAKVYERMERDFRWMFELVKSLSLPERLLSNEERGDYGYYQSRSPQLSEP